MRDNNVKELEAAKALLQNIRILKGELRVISEKINAKDKKVLTKPQK